MGKLKIPKGAASGGEYCFVPGSGHKKWPCSLVAILALVSVPFILGAQTRGRASNYLVREGRATSVIVLDASATGLYRLAAEELQRYIGKLSGIEPPIVGPEAIASQPKDQVLLLVGGPGASSIVRTAAEKGQIDFKGLKPEGYVLKTVQVEGRPALVIGGNDEAGTLYGAYDWLERQGIVFLMGGDVVPDGKPTLSLEIIDVRLESPFRRRGIIMSMTYPHQTILSYRDFVKMIDQMAKLKFNYYIFKFNSYHPFLTYSYRGEKKLMGDNASWETGYMLTDYNFGTLRMEDVVVGKAAFEKFGKGKYMAPDEWQGIQDQDQVYALAQERLRKIIHYAKTRNIKVWLALESLNSAPPNLGRFGRPAASMQPFIPILGGAFVCPADAVLEEINESRFKALVDTYPEAEGFFFWIPENYPLCDQPEDKEFLARERLRYKDLEEAVRKHFPGQSYVPTMDRAIASSIGSLYLVQKIMEFRDRVSPRTKVGIGGWGRSYTLPSLDKTLPKDVPFVDQETSGVWTIGGVPWEHFGGMGERERIFIHSMDDDAQMVGLQFNVGLYEHDQLLQGALKQGLSGILGWTARLQGTEWLTKYISEGTWNTNIKRDEFYRNYARRVFGVRAEEAMYKVLMTLEEKESFGGYHANKVVDNRRVIHAPLWNQSPEMCCSPPEALTIAKKYAEQPNPYGGPVFGEWKPFVAGVPRQIKLYSNEVALLEKALGQMETARTLVAPHGQYKLAYLQSKTQAYQLYMKSYIEMLQAYLELDAAFQVDRRTQRDEFLHRLDGSYAKFREAQVMTRQSGQKWAEIVDDPGDLGVLYRMNGYLIVGSGLVADFMETIYNYHHGKPYLKPVAWEKVFKPLPVFAPKKHFTE